jgi:hypothetical protein
MAEPWKDTTCDAHLDCMLSNLTESMKVKIATAAVFLGILPSLLSMSGPCLTHLTLLSARRPILALCIAAANPGYYVDRLFTIESPAETFEQYGNSRFVPRLMSPRWAIFFSVLEYLLLGASIFNVWTLSLRIGDRVILSFQCRIWYLPLIWMISFIAIFLCVAVPFQFSRTAKHMRACDSKWTDSGRRQLIEDEGGVRWVGDRGDWEGDKSSNHLTRFLAREFTPGARQASLDTSRIPHYERWMAICLNVGYLLTSLHIIVGTCWFSSILFLSPKDAMFIILRYFASSVGCRLIMAIELSGLKAREDKHLSK